jgi:hypothetical protein
MTNEQKFDQVSRRVQLFRTFMASLDYNLERSDVDVSALLGKSTIWHFKNPTINCVLDIRFTCQNKYVHDSFSLYLVRENGRYLDIDEYLKSIGVTDFSSKIVRADSQDFGDFLNTFFTTIQILMVSELKSLLQGREWQDQSFNWRGHR